MIILRAVQADQAELANIRAAVRDVLQVLGVDYEGTVTVDEDLFGFYTHPPMAPPIQRPPDYAGPKGSVTRGKFPS